MLDWKVVGVLVTTFWGSTEKGCDGTFVSNDDDPVLTVKLKIPEPVAPEAVMVTDCTGLAALRVTE